MRKMHSDMVRWGTWLNLSVIAVVSIDLLLLLFVLLDFIGDLVPEGLIGMMHTGSPVLLFLAAILPAAVASLNGIRFQSECRRLADRSGIMQYVLSALRDDLNTLAGEVDYDLKHPDTAAGSRTYEAMALAEQCGRVAVDEVAEWSVLYSKKLVEP